MRELTLLTLAAVAILLMVAQPYAATAAQVNGSVTVICPFSLYLRMPGSFPRLPAITANYTVYSTQSCALGSNIAGTFTVLNQTSNVVVFQEPVSVSGNGQASVQSSLQFSTANMLNLSYTALLSFSVGKYTQSTENSFALVNYANVVITKFAAPQSVNIGAPISFAISMQNVGQAATSPIYLNFSVAGPQSFNAVYQISALSPSQSSNYTISLGNVTGVTGTYTASITASYNSLGRAENATATPIAYTVSNQNPNPQGGGSSSGSQSVPASLITPLPQIAFTFMPILVSGQPGQVEQSQLSFQNNGNSTEQISLSVNSNYSSMLTLSPQTLTLLPNKTGTVQAIFRPDLTLPTGVYTIPVVITAAYSDPSTATATEYLTFSVYRQGGDQPTVVSQVYLTNSSRLANGVISIIAPRNSSISNATLVQWIPLSVANSASDISFYGLPTNITIQNGSYRVSSYIGNLPRNQTIYEYYSIKGAVNPQLLVRSQYMLYSVSPTKSSDILELTDISAPSITGNAIGTVTVSMLYTGTKAQQVYFTVIPPPEITLANYTQNVTALPNELLVRQFKILRHPSNGTYLVQLYIRTEGANLSYGVPILINPPTTQQVSGGAQFLPLYLRLIIFIALVIIVIALLRGRIGVKPRYSPERAGHLIRIREQIKRGEQ